LYVVDIYIYEQRGLNGDSYIVLIKVRRFLNFCLTEKPKYINNKVLRKMKNLNFHIRCITYSDCIQAPSESWISFKHCF